MFQFDPFLLTISAIFVFAGFITGVIGLGWWVLRGDARNRAPETLADTPPESTENQPHH